MSALYSNKCYTANCTRRLVRQYITTCRCTLRPLTSSGGGSEGLEQSACPSPPEVATILSRRRPGTYFSIKHLHKTFTAYGARMQCKSFIVRIGRILRILSATPTPAHYSMPGNTLLTAPRCRLSAWPNARLDTFNFYKFNPWQTTATSATSLTAERVCATRECAVIF